jgi:hypothetical protein
MAARSSTDKPALRSADRRQHEQFNGYRKKTRPKKEVEAGQGGYRRRCEPRPQSLVTTRRLPSHGLGLSAAAAPAPNTFPSWGNIIARSQTRLRLAGESVQSGGPTAADDKAIAEGSALVQRIATMVKAE